MLKQRKEISGVQVTLSCAAYSSKIVQDMVQLVYTNGLDKATKHARARGL